MKDFDVITGPAPARLKPQPREMPREPALAPPSPPERSAGKPA